MDFLAFKKSITENKVHLVSPEAMILPLNVDKPVYLLKSSGSTSQKSYLHSLGCIDSAVKSFLTEFPMSEVDRWGTCLSREHVAGFSILARSHFGNMQDPYFFKWSVESLIVEVLENNVSVLSLVPTQVFDLISKGVKAPKRLKHVFVGGAPISLELMGKAKKLGWPLVMCYGSTETFAQMSYSLDGKNFKAFSGWSVSLNKEKEILVEGPGLYWASIDETGEFKKNKEEVFNTKDLGSLSKNTFSILGKSNGLVKIKESYFDFNKFKNEFVDFLNKNNFHEQLFFPVVLFEERNGAGVYLICVGVISNRVVESYFQFRGAFQIKNSVFSSIGKVDRLKLERELLRPVLSV